MTNNMIVTWDDKAAAIALVHEIGMSAEEFTVHGDAIVQAFARHRTTSLAAQDLVDCETCCGNGEVVTDWERYKHPHDGDVGDEAVADCPDCDGNGKIEVPSLAAQDGLVEALEDAIAFMAGDISGSAQRDGIIKQAQAALSAIKGDKS